MRTTIVSTSKLKKYKSFIFVLEVLVHVPEVEKCLI